jgi:hypothetical protein
MVNFMPHLLYPRGYNPHYPLDKRLDGPQSQSGHCGEEKNLLSLPGILTNFLGHPACCLVTIVTELSGLYVTWEWERKCTETEFEEWISVTLNFWCKDNHTSTFTDH